MVALHIRQVAPCGVGRLTAAQEKRGLTFVFLKDVRGVFGPTEAGHSDSRRLSRQGALHVPNLDRADDAVCRQTGLAQGDAARWSVFGRLSTKALRAARSTGAVSKTSKQKKRAMRMVGVQHMNSEPLC